MSHEAIADYAELMSGGKGRGNAPSEFPPVRIFYVPKEGALYLTAGHHRWLAAEQAGKECFAAEFITGTKQDAVVDSISSNAAHGLRPSREDVRASVKMLLDIAKYRKASDRHLFRIIGCSPTTVGIIRREQTDQADSDDDGTRVDKNGRAIQTANIGKSKKQKTEQTAADAEECQNLCRDDDDAEEHADDATDQDGDAPVRRRFTLPDDPTEAEMLAVGALAVDMGR